MNLLLKLQKIDRRVLYLLIALVITVPLLARPAKHPEIVFREVHDAYSAINDCPKDKIVLISTFYGPGTAAENGPQTEALVRNMLQKNIKFAIISWDQAGNEITYEIVKKVETELGKEYGKDWVHLGYRILYSPSVVIRGIAEDFPKVLERDRFGTPLSKLPAVSGVRNYKQIGAVVEITPSGTVEYWIAYFTGVYKVPLVFCPTAVMAAEAYPFLDSGQIAGMLNGVIGAAQYETLIGLGDVATDASATAWALSSAHIFILLLILVGNLGYIASRRIARRNGGRS